MENGELKDYDYCLCACMYDFKQYGFDWDQANGYDGTMYYYKYNNSNPDDMTEISEEEYNKLSIEMDDYIHGTLTKDDIMRKLN